MNNENKASEFRVSPTDFKCNVCNGPLDYVQRLNDNYHIQEDFFLCKHCGTRVESRYLEEEDIPEFYD